MQFMNKLISRYKNIPKEIKASFWYTACSIIQKCISFITLPIFARILSTTQYGQVSIYSSWVSIIVIFSTLNLQYGSFNTAMEKFQDDRDGYISAIQGLCLVLTMIILSIFLFVKDTLSSIMDLPFFLIAIMLIEILGTAIINFWAGKQRYEYKYQLMVIVTLGMTFFSVLLSLIFVFISEEKGYARIIGNSIITILFGGFFFYINKKRGKHLFNKEYWLYGIKFNLPLIPYYLSQMVFNQSDRLMINKMVGIEEAGIYNIAYTVSIVLTFVLTAINNSYIPWLYKKLRTKEFKIINSITIPLIVLISILLIFLIFIAPELIMIIAGKPYMEAVWIVPPVAISQFFLFLSQLNINVMFYYEDKFSLVKGSIMSAILNLLLNYIFIKKFGYLAAGYTTLAAYIIFWLSNMIYMNKICHSKIKNYTKTTLYNVKDILFVMLVFIFLSILSTCLYSFIYLRLGIIFIISIVAVFNYRRIIKYMKKFRLRGKSNE